MKTEVVKIDPDHPDDGVLSRAAELVKRSSLVAFPTETVYGLAADFSSEKALNRLYETKKRPRNKPFTVHISALEEISRLSCKMTPLSRKLAAAFWPGPLTLIIRKDSGGTLAFRMPRHAMALNFIRACNVPVVAPSANMSGNPPPRSAKEVLHDLNGVIDMVLDAGRTSIGVASTVVDATGPAPIILRDGAISRSGIETI